MRLLITGGAGFIGSRCAEYFKDTHDIITFDNMSYGFEHNIVDGKEFILGDVRDANTIDSLVKRCDVVLHFAAIAPLPDNQEYPSKSFDNNVIGTINLLESCRKHGIKKFMLASTSAVYENNKEEVLTEDLKVCPDLVYSLSKKTAEEVALSYYTCYGVPVTIIRFFNVFGPHQNFSRVAPPLMVYIARELYFNRTPVLHSDGRQSRDYVHVNDICRLIKLVIEDDKSSGEIFNACGGKTWSVNDIYKICSKHLNSEIKPVFRSSENLWNSHYGIFEGEFPMKKDRIRKETEKYAMGSYEKARLFYDWKPTISFEQGVRETIDAMISDISCIK